MLAIAYWKTINYYATTDSYMIGERMAIKTLETLLKGKWGGGRGSCGTTRRSGDTRSSKQRIRNEKSTSSRCYARGGDTTTKGNQLECTEVVEQKYNGR